MNSSEIRQALRDGVVDPFDRVVLEGSNNSRQLVECDDIFNLNEEGEVGDTKIGFNDEMEDSSLPSQNNFFSSEPSKVDQTNISYRRTPSKSKNKSSAKGQSKNFYIKNKENKSATNN